MKKIKAILAFINSSYDIHRNDDYGNSSYYKWKKANKFLKKE